MITIAKLFFGQEEILSRILQELAKGRLAKDIAEELVRPILGHLEANADQALDPTYVVYTVEYAKSQSKS